MTIGEQIGNMLAKRREDKAREKQMVEDSKLQDKIEFKKLTPEERQLAHHDKMEKMKSDRARLHKIWNAKEKTALQNNQARIPFVFKDEKKLNTGKSVFAPRKREGEKILFKDGNVFKSKNVFASKNIFTSRVKGGKKKR
jgi:hypothetical protein